MSINVQLKDIPLPAAHVDAIEQCDGEMVSVTARQLICGKISQEFDRRFEQTSDNRATLITIKRPEFANRNFAFQYVLEAFKAQILTLSVEGKQVCDLDQSFYLAPNAQIGFDKKQPLVAG